MKKRGKQLGVGDDVGGKKRPANNHSLILRRDSWRYAGHRRLE